MPRARRRAASRRPSREAPTRSPGRSPATRARRPSCCPAAATTASSVNKAPTTLTYTGRDPATNGPITLTSTLTATGRRSSGQPVVMTLGSGKSAQSCTGHHERRRARPSCTVPSVNQVQGSVTVTASYAGNTYYQSSSSTSSTVGDRLQWRWRRWRWPGGGGGGGGCGGTGGGGQRRRLPASGRGLRAGLLLRFPLGTIVL